MRFNTDFPADSVEFCPHPLAQNILACGTYNLVQQEDSLQKRLGKCMIFDVDHEDNLLKVQEFALPAVLDMKWCHTSSSVPPVLSIADSQGNVSLHSWDSGERVMTELSSISCAPSDVLCLSLDWSNRRCPGDQLGSSVASFSDGSLSLMDPNDAGLTLIHSWHAHEYEPWIAAWDYWNNNLMFSGGDDLKMKGWDRRQGSDSPTFINDKFQGGVTTIQSHPFMEHILAVGSYDETVRIFDKRKPLTPLLKADVGGGVWRVKWHPSVDRKSDLLLACMHDGFKVIQFALEGFENNSPGYRIVKRYDEHASLAYGADWSFNQENQEGTLIASCSYYDHALHLWRG